MKAGLGIVLVALAVLAGVTAAPAAAGGGVTMNKNCSLSADEAESLGASYVYPLKVRHTSCSKGKKVAKAFNACRKQHGGRDGHCNSRVLGFKCKEGKRVKAPQQYSAHVGCTHGSKKVVFDYTQNT